MNHHLKEAYESEILYLEQQINNWTTKTNQSTLGEYLITLSKINNININILEETKIKNFFKAVSESDQIKLLQTLKILKKQNKLQIIKEIKKSIKSKGHFRLIKRAYSMGKLCIFLAQENNLEINNAIVDLTKLLEININRIEFPDALLYILQKMDKSELENGESFLNYQTHLSTSLKFIKPFQKRIDKLNSELEKENKKEKLIIKDKNRIENQMTNLPNAFYNFQESDKKLWSNDENKQYYWLLLTKHNETILKQKKHELQLLKEKLNNEWINLFLNQGYNITQLDNEIQAKIKNNTTYHILEKILKLLKEKEFQFITVTHPLFKDILIQTSEEVLKSIKEEINEKRLSHNFLIMNPEILFVPYYRYYKKNKNTIIEKNLPFSFFWNNNLLLAIPQKFEQIVNLIIRYGLSNIPFHNLSYFDQKDYEIENREQNLTIANLFPSYLTPEINDLMQKENPYDITEIEKEAEIIFLDSYYKLDALRYNINGMIISRLKVLRYFKMLNKSNENKKENIQNAILYHCQLFEFEKDELINSLQNSKRLLTKE